MTKFTKEEIDQILECIEVCEHETVCDPTNQSPYIDLKAKIAQLYSEQQ